MTRNMMLVAVAALVAALCGARAEDKPMPTAFDDAVFVKAVAIGGMYDVYRVTWSGRKPRTASIRKPAVASRLITSASTGLRRLRRKPIEPPTKLLHRRTRSSTTHSRPIRRRPRLGFLEGRGAAVHRRCAG